MVLRTYGTKILENSGSNEFFYHKTHCTVLYRSSTDDDDVINLASMVPGKTDTVRYRTVINRNYLIWIEPIICRKYAKIFFLDYTFFRPFLKGILKDFYSKSDSSSFVSNQNLAKRNFKRFLFQV